VCAAFKKLPVEVEVEVVEESIPPTQVEEVVEALVHRQEREQARSALHAHQEQGTHPL